MENFQEQLAKTFFFGFFSLGSVQGNGVCEAPEVLNHFPSTAQVKNVWNTSRSVIPEAGRVTKDLIPGKDAVRGLF